MSHGTCTPSSDIVVYTASFGSRADAIREPTCIENDVKFVAFVDDPTKFSSDSVWEYRPPVYYHDVPRRQARWHKCLSHLLFNDAEYTLWIDANFQLQQSISEIIKKYLAAEGARPGAAKYDICTFKHPWRNCIYGEATTCISVGMDKKEIITAQMDRYRQEKYPKDNGLAATMQVLRRQVSTVNQMNDLWWDEILKGSQRDQLSFDYACWRHHLAYGHFDGYCYGNDIFKHNPHGGMK